MNKLTNENNAELTGFAKLGITGQLLRATAIAGFDTPKPVQEKAIPPYLAGRDQLHRLRSRADAPHRGRACRSMRLTIRRAPPPGNETEAAALPGGSQEGAAATV